VANARDVLTQLMAIFGYRKASLIAGTRPPCAQVVPCGSCATRRLRKPGLRWGVWAGRDRSRMGKGRRQAAVILVSDRPVSANSSLLFLRYN
jgi:hypothetical protein